MKLLAQKSVAANGECKTLMRRGEHYLIANLTLPIAAAMTEKDFESRDMMLLSHPGWRRCSFSSELTEMVKLFYRKFMELVDKDRTFSGMAPRDREFLRSQVVKNAFTLLEPNYLYEELQFEMALQWASNRNMPMVMTVACEEEPRGAVHRYRLANDFEGGYADYLNTRVRGMEHIYVIPTTESSGIAIDEKQTRWKMKEPMEGWSGTHSLHPEEGVSSQMFGKLLTHRWDTIYVGGGAIAHCMRGMLGYFITNPSRIRLVDDFCYPNNKKPIAFDEELKETVRKAMARLFKETSEPRMRFGLFKMLRGLESGTKKTEEYLELFGMFNSLGIKKDSMPGGDSHLDIVHLFPGSGPGESYFFPYRVAISGEVRGPQDHQAHE